MSTGPMLPENVRRAIHEEVRRLVDKLDVTQTEIAKRIGVSQGMIAKVYDRPEVGAQTAEKFFAVYGSKEELLTRHRLRDPAPETDLLVGEFIDWIEGTPAIKKLARRPDVTVKDLLRVRKTPLRRGEADATEVYAHILQLRAGEIGGLPAEELSSADLDRTLRKRTARGAR